MRGDWINIMEDGISMPLWGLFVYCYCCGWNGIFTGLPPALKHKWEWYTEESRKAIKSTNADGSTIDKPAQFVFVHLIGVMAYWWLVRYFSGPAYAVDAFCIAAACACTDHGNGIVRDFSLLHQSRYSGFSAGWYPIILEAYAYIKYLNWYISWLNLLKAFLLYHHTGSPDCSELPFERR